MSQTKASIDAKDEFGRTELLRAALRGDAVATRKLLQLGAQVNVTNDYGWTPLIAASFGGHFRVVKILLDKGANVNARDSDGNTALMIAVSAAAGPSSSPITTENALSFEEAATRVVQGLLSKGADVNIRNKHGETALLWARSYRPKNDKFIELLLKAGARE